MDTTTIQVTYLEGIGPASAAGLADIGVHSVADIVRADAALLRAATGGRISTETAERWRAMALLVEMDGCDNQLAEALARAGVNSTEQVWQRDVDELGAIFSAAANAGTIPTVPDTDALREMRLDAAVLTLSGSLNGTVLDPDGEPVVGAAVEIGDLNRTTDDRGRFRANRIPLGRPTQVLIRHPGFESLLIEDVAVLPDDAMIQVTRFNMDTPLADGQAASAIRLCEWEGDRLPPLSHQPVTTRAMGGPDALREGDVLLLHRYYASGDDAQLTSKFLQYDDGRFITLNWRVPLSMLPVDHGLKQVYRFRGGAFRRIRLSPSFLQNLLALRRARSTRVSGAPPATPMEVDVAVGLMSDHFPDLRCCIGATGSIALPQYCERSSYRIRHRMGGAPAETGWTY